MKQFSKIHRSATCILTVVIALVAVLAQCAFATPAASQASFDTPQAAVAALVAAVRANDSARTLAVLGPDAADLVTTADAVADKTGRERFLRAQQARTRLMLRSDGSVALYLGTESWPFPIPLVKQGASWRFDTAAGHQEILNRRVGANELNALQVCAAYVEAQREYATQDREGDSIIQYAQRFRSEPGKHNGLYWSVSGGEELSPMGPLVAEAEAEGYTPGQHNGNFHGYRFRIVKRQGAAAPGGAYDYVNNGHMVGGFALVAWPASYGETGVMTFIVNQNGIIFEKDLGQDTEAQAKSMTDYNPDETWKSF